MLSFGIRFGQGFDKSSVLKMMQLITEDFDYDFLVIGSSPGGVASAREAKLAGKRVAIIRTKRYSPPEAEGFDEDLQKMADALEILKDSSSALKIQDVASSALKIQDVASSHSKTPFMKESVMIPSKASSISWKKSSATMSSVFSTGKKKSAAPKTSENLRKVRLSRLDLNNELYKRGQQCRKLMHNAALFGDLAETANKFGWRVVTATKPPSINWRKMTEEIMDFVMKENFRLLTELKEECIDVIEGLPSLTDHHTVTVFSENGSEKRYTAELICIAMSSECILPHEIPGAIEFGITYDDFVRMDTNPGKTLIVGGTPEGLECAGILACSKIPVTVVSRSNILKSHDSELTQLIVNDLKSKGVIFKTETTLTVIKKTSENKLFTTFMRVEYPDNTSDKIEITQNDLYDTVLFAVGRKVNFEGLNIFNLGLDFDSNSEKILTDKVGTTTVPHIFAIGDAAAGVPEDFEVSELSGKLLGKRLFHNATAIMDNTLIPSVIYTPTEYAFVGLSEDEAYFRLGNQCIDIYYGDFKPLDFVIPDRKGNCFAKIIVFKRSDAIIGLHIFGPEAGEMIQGFAAAIKTGLTMTDFRTIVGVTGTKVQEIFKLKAMKIHEPETEASEW